jgi:hypothetical protein
MATNIRSISHLPEIVEKIINNLDARSAVMLNDCIGTEVDLGLGFTLTKDPKKFQDMAFNWGARSRGRTCDAFMYGETEGYEFALGMGVIDQYTTLIIKDSIKQIKLYIAEWFPIVEVMDDGNVPNKQDLEEAYEKVKKFIGQHTVISPFLAKEYPAKDMYFMKPEAMPEFSVMKYEDLPILSFTSSKFKHDFKLKNNWNVQISLHPKTYMLTINTNTQTMCNKGNNDPIAIQMKYTDNPTQIRVFIHKLWTIGYSIYHHVVLSKSRKLLVPMNPVFEFTRPFW